MLSTAGHESCGYGSGSSAHHHDGGGVTTTAVAVVAQRLQCVESAARDAVSWWTADASTSALNVVDPAARNNVDGHGPISCGWPPAFKDHTGNDELGRQCHPYDWAADPWSSGLDDLLPTSETYKWMTVKRSTKKSGTLTE